VLPIFTDQKTGWSSTARDYKPGQILISPRVLMKVENAVTVEPVGEFALKGIRRPLAAYNVLAAARSQHGGKPWPHVQGGGTAPPTARGRERQAHNQHLKGGTKPSSSHSGNGRPRSRSMRRPRWLGWPRRGGAPFVVAFRRLGIDRRGSLQATVLSQRASRELGR
jgi:hypothetical protein